MLQNDSDVYMNAVLAQLSAHMDLLAGQISEIETELGSVLSQNPVSGHQQIKKIQTLDFVRQSLEDCALLTHFISLSGRDLKFDNDFILNLVSKLKLASTRKLIGSCDNEGKLAEITDSGTLDLF